MNTTRVPGSSYQLLTSLLTKILRQAGYPPSMYADFFIHDSEDLERNQEIIAEAITRIDALNFQHSGNYACLLAPAIATAIPFAACKQFASLYSPLSSDEVFERPRFFNLHTPDFEKDITDSAAQNSASQFNVLISKRATEITRKIRSKRHITVLPSIENPDKPEDQALLEAIQTFVYAIEIKGMEKALSKIDDMVKVFSDAVPAPRYNMREAKMIAKAQEKVINSTEWVNSSEISELAGFKSKNKSACAAKWKSSRKIFSVNYFAEELFPIYAFNKQNAFRPEEGLKPILDLFDGEKDSWGIAYWFAGANSFLDGKRPQDLLHEAPNRVLDAANDELLGITHG